MRPNASVLVIDDEEIMREILETLLAREGYTVRLASAGAEGLELARSLPFDAVIVDMMMPGMDGLSVLEELHKHDEELPVIMITAFASMENAIAAMKKGAFDYITKPFKNDEVLAVLRNAVERRRLMAENVALKQNLQARYHKFSGIIGKSPRMKQVFDLIIQAAPSRSTILITGESGTGKELVANTIHASSERKSAAFVKVNCSAIPENLVESELFGYERGAFSGAAGSKKGLFEVAHRGTLFLDEIADLSLAAQAKILRVLQSGEIQKVGAERTIKVDVRVLSGTHKDLKSAVKDGAFREDLFYRLDVVRLRVPSLRERPDDIPLLARFLARRLCEKNNLKEKPLDEEVLWELKQYPWPGNVRELENVLERMLIMSGDRITAIDLPDELLATAEGPLAQSAGRSALKEHRDKAERDFIVGVLRKHNGNISQSAIELGVGRPYLHKRMTVLGITKRDFLV
jgi:two-component system, NtrC family, nitrogen regulation response regulator NtrX